MHSIPGSDHLKERKYLPDVGSVAMPLKFAIMQLYRGSRKKKKEEKIGRAKLNKIFTNSLNNHINLIFKPQWLSV